MASPIFQMRLDPEQRARWEAAAETRGYDKLAEFVKGCVDHEIDGGYRTKSGRIITDAEIEALSVEAERGYDPATVIASPVAPTRFAGGKVFKGPDPKGGKAK